MIQHENLQSKVDQTSDQVHSDMSRSGAYLRVPLLSQNRNNNIIVSWSSSSFSSIAIVVVIVITISKKPWQ